MSADRQTLQVYAERARDYAKRFEQKEDDKHLATFVAALPDGARVLDFGCGAGGASAGMIAAGCQVDSWDASPELADMALAHYGVRVRHAFFDDLDESAVYDGVYANFSLLHAPKAEMPGHLARIAKALKPGGVFHIGLKKGEGEKRDPLGRFYAYYQEDELSGLLADAGFAVTSITFGDEPGLDGVVAPFMIVLTRKI